VNETRIADLAMWAGGQPPALVDNAYAAIVDRIPMYRTGDLFPRKDLHQSITQNLRFLVGAIAHPDAPLDLTAPQATGRRRARQGVPLPRHASRPPAGDVGTGAAAARTGRLPRVHFEPVGGAYVEHGGSAVSAAKVLHCHPNTVRYRLRHLHELTGARCPIRRTSLNLPRRHTRWRLSPGAGSPNA
jgi:hypothetical protein